MGLLGSFYEFEGSTPSYEDIAGKICDIVGHKVPWKVENLQQPDSTDEEVRRQFPMERAYTVLLSRSHLRLQGSGRRYLHVTRSIHRHRLCASGNSAELLDAFRKAAGAFGGVEDCMGARCGHRQ